MCILFNCITLGMYQPCADEVCTSSRCRLLEMFDDFIFAFFAIEMMIKTIAMGITGKGSYMSDSWNRLDCFIVFAGCRVIWNRHRYDFVDVARLKIPNK
ncbi:voltage-dependent T-type calcium channel subunit alpha-1G [Trichonephila inaurata madagascariensis]|uniref:Voltage-dependent T-type calcium channel subunit alpha-1G n=1 Tax=Trichonephila inaurata madagascariensis TaxID=2747483 RepID=A0A8X6X910_9ARAC|nr:voltage-dependent T-type calcium channel subunit alpha-1G [Trichonephila inaurata madagascariensis]